MTSPTKASIANSTLVEAKAVLEKGNLNIIRAEVAVSEYAMRGTIVSTNVTLDLGNDESLLLILHKKAAPVAVPPQEVL